ncbi:elongation factor Tu [uncultured Maribacter sp.]|uniref:elongation factor Tu n=1 Tax=uncultured Maribacter sp. TaxID=431308 RepID=UPI00261EA8DD|nr:elongation factor Tu [uncultured Maribacter sp.]
MTGIDFIAELEFLTTEKGGRKGYAKSGYRPHIEFENYPEILTTGQQTYIGKDTVEPGEKIKAKIAILSTEYFSNRLYENMEFKFCEGPRTVGYGQIIEIINSDLKSDPKIKQELINLNLYPKDILDRIKIVYGGLRTDFKIISELQELIMSEDSLRNPRLIRAIIYLFTIGKIDRKKVFQMAKTDWRDILMCAEYKYIGGNEKSIRVRDFNNEFGNETLEKPAGNNGYN